MIIIAINIKRFQLLWSFDSVNYRQLLSSEDVIICDMIIVINHIIHHWTNVANAKMKYFRNFLIQSKKRAKTTKNRLRLFKTENQQLLNIFEIERVKVEMKFNDEMMKNRATTTTMKKKLKKRKNERSLKIIRMTTLWRRSKMSSKRRL